MNAFDCFKNPVWTLYAEDGEELGWVLHLRDGTWSFEEKVMRRLAEARYFENGDGKCVYFRSRRHVMHFFGLACHIGFAATTERSQG